MFLPQIFPSVFTMKVIASLSIAGVAAQFDPTMIAQASCGMATGFNYVYGRGFGGNSYYGEYDGGKFCRPDERSDDLYGFR